MMERPSGLAPIWRLTNRVEYDGLKFTDLITTEPSVHTGPRRKNLRGPRVDISVIVLT